MKSQSRPQKISSFQAVVLVSQTITPTAILVIPELAIGAASSDAWIAMLAGWAIGIGFAILFGSLSRRHPEQTILGAAEQNFGRGVGFAVSLVLAMYFLSTTSVALREFVNFLSDELLERTPPFVLAIVPIIVALYAVAEGIETIARMSVIVYFASLIFLALGVGLQINQMHPEFLLPVGEASASQLVRGGLPTIGWLSEASILLLLTPHLVKPRSSRRIGIGGVSLAAGQLLLVVLLVLLLFGDELPKMMTYPTFATAEVIRYGTFVERVDLMFICIWITTVYVKLCIFLFGTVQCFSHAFKIRAEKPFRIALGLLVLFTALYSWPKNSLLDLYQQLALTPFLLTMNVVVPFLLWLGLLVKKRKNVRSEGS